MPIWHQSPKLTPRYFLETPRLFGYPVISAVPPKFHLPYADDTSFLTRIHVLASNLRLDHSRTRSKNIQR